MGFCGKIDDGVNVADGNCFLHVRGVTDVTVNEMIARSEAFTNCGKVFETTGVGQLIENSNSQVGIAVQNVSDKIAADKAGTACNQDILHQGLLESRCVGYARHLGLLSQVRRSLLTLPGWRLAGKGNSTPRVNVGSC